MSVCPFCDHDNIEGADVCEQCEQPLSEEYLKDEPLSDIERRVLKDRVSTLKPKVPITVSADTTLGQAMNVLLEEQIGCVVVEEEGKPVGIFSERDALMKVGARMSELSDAPVGEFMTQNPNTLDLNAKVAFAIHRMDLGSFRHIPIVTEDGDLTGIISVRDILRYLTETMDD